MGVIKDGSISGNLPSTKVFAVNYPGYPSSTEHALVTLGGPEGIAKARELSKELELHFRPEDPYSHPVPGKSSLSKNFLLKISKHKTQEDETPTTEEPEDKIYADIVSHVTEAYNFNGMADYQQVLAVHADVARKKKRTWADVEPQFEKHGLIDADQEDLMILLPSRFSLKDTPENLVLKPSMFVPSKKKQEELVKYHREMDIDPSLMIDFNIKDVPKKVNWEKFMREGTNEWKCQKAVCQLFDERPIWIKQSLSEHLSKKGLKFGPNLFKRLLYNAAYYFGGGPFHRFWIRKEYDPRKDPESRIYQRTDFRVDQNLRYGDNDIASGINHKWEDLCAFRAFPSKYHTSFQLFELADDYIQQEISKPVTQTTCTLATGWFPPHILAILRKRVAVRFLSVYPHPGAESLLKSAVSRFEKLKRASIMIKEKIGDEEEHQRVNKDEVHMEEKEISDDEDEDDDDDAVDDDEVDEDSEEEIADEELDTYEGLHMGGDGTNFVPEPSYINQENMSKNYLQELFGSFPYNGGSQENAENSDGEYHIFDHDSDGNISNDD